MTRSQCVYLLRLSVSIIALAAMAFVGCGRPAGAPPIDSKAMAAPVVHLADAAQSPKRFPLVFATGAVPSEKLRKSYAANMYIVTEIHPTSESESELLVRVINPQGEELGNLTWTVAEEAGKWKLKSAPLP